MKVIGLERGPRLTTQDFNPHDELRYFQRQDLRPNIKRQPVTWRPNADARANPMPVLNYGNQAGGGTVHYGAVSWRMHEDDFRARSHTIERYGASAIPADSSLADWPLSYADLEPFYDRAEYELGVSGKAGNLQGRKIDGGNVFEAPRRREYPLPPLLVDQAGDPVRRRRPRSSAITRSRRRARSSRSRIKGRPGCTYCGFCQAFGCHVGAKSSILVTKLPEADATGNFKLVTGAMCYRVNSDNSGRVTGVSYYGPDGSDNTIEAETRHPDDVHLRQHPPAAAVEDGEVPQRSRQFERPAGQARDGAHDGRTCSSASTTGTSTSTWGRARRSIRSTTSTRDNFDHRALGFIRGSQISIGTGNLQGGPIAYHHGHAARRAALGRGYRDFLAKYFSRHAAWWRRPRTCPMPTRPSTSIRTCEMPGACRRHA